MAAAEIRAGKAVVEIAARDAGFRATLTRSQKGLAGFGKRVASLNGLLAPVGRMFSGLGGILAGVGAGFSLHAMASQFLTLGDEAQKAGIRTGLSAEKITALKYAVEQSGGTLSDLETGLRGMSRTLDAAARGSKTAAEAYSRLGLSVSELQAMSPDQAFLAIADAIKGIPEESTRTAAAMAIFGRSATNLMPTLMEGSAGITSLMERAKELGIVISQEDADAAAKLGDNLSDLKTQLQAVAVQIMAALAPSLTAAAEAMQPIIAGVIDFIKENRGLIATVAAVVGVLGAVAAAAVAVGGAFVALSWVIGAVSAIAGALGAVLSFLMSPVGAIVVGVVALVVLLGVLGYYFLTATETGQGLLKMLGKLWEVITRIGGGIWDAVSVGEWQLAGEIAMQALTVAWVSGIEYLRGLWWDFAEWIKTLFRDQIAGLLSQLQRAAQAVGLTSLAGQIAVARLGLQIDLAAQARREGMDAIADEVARLEYLLGAARAAKEKATGDAAEGDLPHMFDGIGRKARAAMPAFAPAAPEIVGLTAGSFNQIAASRIGTMAIGPKKSEELLASIDDRLASIDDKMDDGGLAE